MIGYKDNDEYEDQEDLFAWNKARIRNLKINIAKILISKNDIHRDSFSKKELRRTFAFKEYDFKYLAESLFCVSNDIYTFKNDLKEFLDKVVLSNRAVQNTLLSAETDFIKIYGEFLDNANRHGQYRYEGYPNIYGRIKKFLPILHWGKLPIFNKYLLYNRRCDPEVETVKFYDHIDCLNALLSEIRHQGLSLSNESDKSLDRDMQFKVYTRRWGREDRYTIKRTVDGWYCGHLSIYGECKKDGTGGLIANLKHDSVFFPEDGVKYAMQELWEAADDGEIGFEELSNRIQQVADWISVVEKAVGSQPKWINYY